MIVVMKPGSTQKQIDHVVELIEELGLRSHIIQGTDRTVVAALGEKRDGAKQALETGEGVEKVVPILAPYKMASTEVKKDPTCVEVLQAQGRGRQDRRHRGAMLGRDPRADPRSRPRRARGRRDRLARRSVQAAHQPIQLPGPEGERASNCSPRPATPPGWRSSPK